MLGIVAGNKPKMVDATHVSPSSNPGEGKGLQINFGF